MTLDDRWDEGWGHPGWGEMANGSLLDAVVDGLDALATYAAENPDEGDLDELLAAAEDELAYVELPEKADEVLAAVEAARYELALAAVPVLPVAASPALATAA
ncbi:hypothetical protein ACG83_10975 [Frankia sp. R43]|uniref:hypothetical protein n=1 Tax=Frankia sp. R43 TaxID=269536 RepID=UPI0006D988D5|nr:hypothetical protein [Frankia sp. R43]KPM55788.1 hypothetical protein ACG83_10975 [Frankia sp. R43]